MNSPRAFGSGFLGTAPGTETSNLDSNIVDSALELDENATEDASLLKMDTHVIPLEKLVERLDSNLTTGLTNDAITQHRATFGQNKLTPSSPPSLLWMFIKQLLIGFNGILWIATLFAFLSYVSSEFLFFEKIDDRISLKCTELFIFVETIR
jgi:magnesium-transporting ATPase (P-type)